MFSQTPASSMRNTVLDIGTQHITIRRFLRADLKLFPYRLQKNQEVIYDNELKGLTLLSTVVVS